MDTVSPARSGRAAAVGFSALLCCSCASIPETSDRISGADYAEIVHLYAEFNTALDLGQGDRYAATWTEDGEYTGGRGAGRGAEPRNPDVVGREQLRAMARGNGGRHVVTNIAVTPMPGGAKATAYLVHLDRSQGAPAIIGTSIYDDTLVKTKDGWKFKKRINWRDDDDITPHKAKTPTGPPGQPARPPGGLPPSPPNGR